MKNFAWMILGICLLAGSLTALDRPDYLIRIERQTEGDLPRLLDAGIRVVHESTASLFAEVRREDLNILDKLGFRYMNLDSDPWAWDYYTLGLRSDSDRGTLHRNGTILYEEENWVLWRVEPGLEVKELWNAKVFAGKMPHQPRSKPIQTEDRVKPLLHPVGQRTAVPLVQQIVNSVSTTDTDALWTTISTNSPTGTRYSTSTGCTDIQNWVTTQFQSMGLATRSIAHTTGHAPDIEGQSTGAVNPSVIYMVEGHIDDLPSSGTAPGGDDNGSGSATVMECAKVMSCYAFKNTVRFVTMTGEEFGLYGSTYYANQSYAAGENIQGVLNFDMPGWEGDGLPATGENLDLNYDSNSQSLGLFYALCASDYGTGLPVDAFLCPSLDASDHYQFWVDGYKAVCGITDNEGYCSHAGSYPYYHTSNDTIANCGNLTFFHNAVKATVATLAALGDPFKITLDRSAYGCSVAATIIVGDRDLNTSSTTAQTVQVQAWSTTEPTPETVTLTEDGVNSMIFKGTLQLSGVPAVHGDGLLSVQPGDTITTRYVDALDCNGATNVTYNGTATVSTDCTPPVITNVQVTGLTDASATITWTTNESANSRVTYGSAVPPGTLKDDASTYVTSHSMTLTGLSPCTRYYFSVTSADVVGTSALDANGGGFYSFKTYTPSYAFGPDTVEGGTNGWTATGQWHRDTCKAHGGSYAWKSGSTTCPGTYNNSTTSDLTSTAVALGITGHGYHLTWWEYYSSEAGYDYCRPQISTNGTTWTNLVTQYAGSGATWTLRDVDLAAYTGTVYLRFEFYADSSQVYEGWYVDDIAVKKSIACGPTVAYDSSYNPLTTLTQVCGNGDAVVEPGEEWQVTVRLKNTGGEAATGTQAALAVNAGSGVAAVITLGNPGAYGTIAPAGTSTASYRFRVDASAVCGNNLVFDVNGIASNEDTFPGQTAAFTIGVGVLAAGVDQTATQATSPLNAVNTSASSDLTAAFTPAAADTATVTYTLGYTAGGSQTLVIQPSSADTYLDQTNSTTNYGTATTMGVRNRNGQARRSMVQFDLSGIPAGSTITAATLELYATAAPATAQTLNVHHVTGTWTETGVTWATIPTYAGTADASISGGTATGWKIWTVTPVVQAWLAGTYTNYGVLVKCNVETNSTSYAYTISSKENATTANRPILRVTYTPPGGTLTANSKVELLGPGSGVWTLKDYGSADPAKPINVLSYYNAAGGGAGTWKIRVSENAGGTASVTSASMHVTRAAQLQCNVAACGGAVPSEAAPGGSSSSGQSWTDKNTQGWPAVSGATWYNVYRGILAQLPNLVTSGTDSCMKAFHTSATSVACSENPSGEAGKLYWYLVTAGNAIGEGTAGSATAGLRTLNSSGTCP